MRGRGEGKGYRKRGNRHEHRVVAEEMLGRPLLPGEVVHHIDENKQNNDPSNLRVLPSQSEHAAGHGKKCLQGYTCGRHRKPTFTAEHRARISAGVRAARAKGHSES